MKKFLIAIAMMLSLGIANAASSGTEIDTRGLTATQKAELVKQAEAMKASTPLETAEKVDKWVDVGERLGKMMGGAAREVGIAVNDFVKTPVGLMTAGLIVWNYMGSMLIHVVGGFTILFITFGLLTWYSRRLRTVEVKYDKEAGKNWLGRYPVLSREVSKIDDDSFGFLLLAYGASLAVSIITIFTW